MQLGIVGREAELAAVEGFLEARGAARGLVLMGAPGIGKTTLWEAGNDAARRRGFRVLATRASESELSLSFVALSDLLEGVDEQDLAAMPAPQRHALEVALQRAQPGDTPPEPLAVSAGFTTALRNLALEQPLLVAVDDVSWLERSSAGVIAFAARRLRRHPVRFLLARRLGEPSLPESVFERDGLDRLELGGLSLGATRELLSGRLRLTLRRRLLRRVFDAAQGNPLFVLELGRMLLERGAPEITAELPVPDLVDDLFRERVSTLAEPVRRALLAVALSPGVTRSELVALAGPLAVENAITSGLIVVQGDRLRPSHPLLAAAARSHPSSSQIRALHLELAGVIAAETLRVRHLALASEATDPELARRLAEAAASAIRRGATHEAIELGEHALRLTRASTERSARLLELGRYLAIAGEMQRVRNLLDSSLADLPEGRPRASAHLLLGECAEHPADQADHLERALAHSADDAELRASALAAKSTLFGLNRVRALGEAQALAEEALHTARSAGIEVERRALHALAWILVLRGRPVGELSTEFRDAPQGFSLYESAIERPAGVQLLFRGHVMDARAVFQRLRALAEERGEARSATVMHLQLCETALRAGEVQEASGLLAEWDEWTATEPADSHHSRCQALLAVLQGAGEDAARWAAQALAESEVIGDEWSRLEALRARGTAALLEHQPERAAESLRPVWEHTRREGIDDPGAFPVAPDLVEALVELGHLDEAGALIECLAALAAEQRHPWGMATATRCRALVALAAERREEALRGLTDAAAAYDALGLRFDHARTLLAGGRAARRLTQWGAARRLLEPAILAFEALGCDGWALEARSELGRLGGRRAAASGELTPAERRVAALAAEGLSNKEIAGALVVSVATVETHLKRAYAKLGVRSRAQLGGRLSSEGPSAAG